MCDKNSEMGKGLFTYGFQYPTCLANGAHRYSAPHALGKDRKRWMVKCRLCAQSIVSWFDDVSGKIVDQVQEQPIKASNPPSVL